MNGLQGGTPRLDETGTTLIRSALDEDVADGDWTTLWTVSDDAQGVGRIVAKEALVVAGSTIAAEVFRTVDPRLDVTIHLPDGRGAEAGDVVMEVRGRLRSILTGERVALNFLGRLSGVASLTRRFVSAVEGTGAQIVDTRKTTPGWRFLEKAAVRAGGGVNHRMGLHDMVLVKDNHIEAAGGITAAMQAVRDHNRRGLPVEVEVRSLEELEEALRSPPQRILLDNMSVDAIREAVERVGRRRPPRPLLEASGNVNLSTVRSIAATGVDLISVGALTHSAPSADLSLRLGS